MENIKRVLKYVPLMLTIDILVSALIAVLTIVNLAGFIEKHEIVRLVYSIIGTLLLAFQLFFSLPLTFRVAKSREELAQLQDQLNQLENALEEKLKNVNNMSTNAKGDQNANNN